MAKKAVWMETGLPRKKSRAIDDFWKALCLDVIININKVTLRVACLSLPPFGRKEECAKPKNRLFCPYIKKKSLRTASLSLPPSGGSAPDLGAEAPRIGHFP